MSVSNPTYHVDPVRAVLFLAPYSAWKKAGQELSTPVHLTTACKIVAHLALLIARLPLYPSHAVTVLPTLAKQFIVLTHLCLEYPE
jgi:hypothetical protein